MGVVGVVGVGVVAIAGGGFSPQRVTMASGQNGSAYQRISEQMARSAERVGDVLIEDAHSSRGSQDNLQRVMDGEVMFALVQLDVARPALRQGKVQTVAILAKEYVHLIARSDSGLMSILDLQGKRVAMGQEGSGTAFTAQRLLGRSGLKVQPRPLSFSQGLRALEAGQVDAIAYVGTIGQNKTVRDALENSDPPVTLLAVPAPVANYIAANFPESYHQTVIPEGIYNPVRTQPPQDVPAIATGTALITGNETDRMAISLMTWAVLSTARQYALFYPELVEGDPREVLRRNSLYTAIAAQQVYEKGDPRNAWLRSIQENEVIQEYALALLVTSAIGLLLGWWRQRRSSHVLQASREAITRLRTQVDQDPQGVLDEITQILQRYRLMSLDGAMSNDAYEQISGTLVLVAEQARSVLEQQRQRKIGDTVSVLDQVEVHRQGSPAQRQAAMADVDRQYRALLQAGEVDLSTYLQLRQLGILQLGLLDARGDRSLSSPPSSKPSASAANGRTNRPRVLPKPTPVMPPPRPPIPFPILPPEDGPSADNEGPPAGIADSDIADSDIADSD
ncbi:MAG: TAXI family TRAP transporter solute-binding subunit [Cyanobacteria bacterium P01_H01_bin.130]